MSRKALIVGDAMQLEPVWNIPEHVDKLSLKSFKILKEQSERAFLSLKKAGIPCSSSSLMQRALASCKWEGDTAIGSTHAGAFLSEHRRCVPPLVKFCNELAYQGRLQAKRPGLKKRVLPCFAWGHISGRSEREGTSRKNLLEANGIFEWLCGREESLVAFYGGRSLEETVAVITPFAAQKYQLEKVLRKKWPTMTIGTVNALQGAEREVVIFSPTYDAKYTGQYFFNRSINMLNVAVSRAKDSFVVIGDITIFERGMDPAGILSKYLFARDVHELQDMPQVEETTLEAETVEHLRSLEDHRRVLRASIEESKESLYIVSSQVSIAALHADALIPLLLSAKDRGVEVKIFTDSTLDRDDEGILRETTAKAYRALAESKIELVICENIHNKGIIVDMDLLIVGGFNWLSANRNLNSQFSRYEWSTVSPRGSSEEAIQEMLTDLQHRAEDYQSRLKSAENTNKRRAKRSIA